METEAGMLCIGCLERRLGRQLTPDDFMAAPINDDPMASRLRDRLGLPPVSPRRRRWMRS
jgi:hypothetical protein